VISPEGRITSETWFEIPYYCMMHDFGVTADYILFHVVPSTSSWERLENRLPHFGFDRNRPVHLGVLPKGGKAEDIRWFSAENCFASHVMNAHNEGSLIHFDTPMAAGNMFPFFPDLEGAPFDPQAAVSHMTRWTVDMLGNADDIQMTRLSELIGEFPRIDDRFAGRKNRYGFLLADDKSKPIEAPGSLAGGLRTNMLARIDLETGESDAYWVGASSSIQEPAFIPRPGSTEEGDGYLITLENRLAEMGSRLLIFDAMSLAAGPVATIGLPFRLRHGVHGNWHTAEQIGA
jgi:carotenoid cleavage dioxygenase